MDTFEEEELVDIEEVQRNIANIEAELAQVQAQMTKYLEELGLNSKTRRDKYGAPEKHQDTQHFLDR